MKKNLKDLDLITWMQMTLKMLVILCALACNAQQGNQNSTSQIDKKSQDRNKPNVCFLKGNGHAYGFDDFSNIEKRKSYMTLEKSLVNPPIKGYTYFRNAQKRCIYFDGHIADLHFSMFNHLSPTWTTDSQALASLWCGINGQGNIIATKPVENKELARLTVDIYDRLNIKVLLVHVNITDENNINSISNLVFSSLIGHYDSFIKAVVNVQVDELKWDLSDIQILKQNGTINELNNNQLPCIFLNTYTDYKNYHYIQFEINKTVKKSPNIIPNNYLLGYTYEKTDFSFVFPISNTQNTVDYHPFGYSHELGHCMNAQHDSEDIRFYESLMYPNSIHIGNKLSYINWRRIRIELQNKQILNNYVRPFPAGAIIY